jgi:peptidoglycan/xylan/chitin deacetylase (PgdA/CDA1 family)
VYLTFDDGPHAEATPVVLDILRTEKIKGTFFLLGENVQRRPELANELLKEGHTVGNHTQSHAKTWFSEKDVLDREIRAGQETISRLLHTDPKLFRPPFGLFDPDTIRYATSIGLRTVLFSVNSWDFSDTSPERIAERVVRSTKAGDIIVFHDSDKTAGKIATYLPATIRALRKRGFSFDALL